MMNHVTLLGRLTRDPELRRTGAGTAVASFSLAVDRDYSDKNTGEKATDFLNCVAWRATGEAIAKFFTKGRLILVSGRIQVRPWKDKDGNKRYATEILVSDFYFCGDGKRTAAPAEPEEAAPPEDLAYPAASADDFPDLDDLEAGLPF